MFDFYTTLMVTFSSKSAATSAASKFAKGTYTGTFARAAYPYGQCFVDIKVGTKTLGCAKAGHNFTCCENAPPFKSMAWTITLN